ncbi:hypothetical protein [Gaoshiqia sp. Z1-71]|uniref:gliding motility lipoprotein GldB n=1 Tax=Gaoshiqia hydrogeniformans TaxID=3290090 RepID=UPI003BF87B38
MYRVFVTVFMAVLLFSCQRNPLKVDLSGVQIDLRFYSLDDDLFSASEEPEKKLREIETNFKDFMPVFTYEMIRIGGPDDPDYDSQLQLFLTDTMIIGLKEKADQLIRKDQLKDALTRAFRYYHYYFPEKVIPDIYTCISGFNQSVVMTDSLIGISLDKYLGAGFSYYPRLGIPAYISRNMHPQKIVPEVMYAWGSTEFPFEGGAPFVVDRMIYEGKILYFLDAMLPDVHDTLKIGYTKKQLAFCKAREEMMWTYLAEHKLLFSTERMDIKRYVDEAPYTSGFTTDSPGRAGAWLGWQIVRSYMKKNPEVSLPELMADTNYQGILNQSAYQPGR